MHSHQAIADALSRAQDRAWAPVSGFQVGAVAIGASGRLHLGANLEVTGLPLAHTVHAEQAAVHRAWSAGENRITTIVVTATPCGHCRQFLWELDCAADMEVRVGKESVPLPELLPRPFGPSNLKIHRRLLAHRPTPLRLVSAAKDGDALVGSTLEAASQAYAPYTGAARAVGLQTRDGRVHLGRYAENAAFNPTLEPMLAALSSLRLAGADPSAVERALYVERVDPDATHAPPSSSELVWSSVSAVSLEYVSLRDATVSP